MCGIAGAINFELNVASLNKDLFHRGPDEQSDFNQGNLHLYHYRLSIVDILGGRQPMHFQHLTIVFNGEIYNHKQVREKHRLNCTSNSDTETILLAYDKLGISCLNEFDGMFALAIYDRRSQELILARDRAGKKPVYYFSDGDKFVFASELGALHRQLNLSIDENHLHQYMRMGYFYKSSTAYKNVWELEAGSYATISFERPVVKTKKWWNIHPFYLQKSNDSFETAFAKTDAILQDAIKNRVESSDIEVGSFLSGGIDSGIVTAIARKYNNSLKTFTVSFDTSYDEAPLAKLVADKVGTKHHEIKISFTNLLFDIEKILANYGEPFYDSSAIPSYYVSQEAKKYLTVILNGDGGDEIFGGYRRYVPFAKYDFFGALPLLTNSAALVHKVLPVANYKNSHYNFIYRLFELASKKGLNTYLAATIDIFEGYERNLKATKNSLQQVESDFKFISKSSLSGLQKIMNLDFDNILPGDLLVKMDIATMAHSLEGRSPLLCKDLLEYIPTLSDNFKIKGTQTKHLLRTLAKKYLPPELIHQPKRGFEIPLKNWVDNELREIISDYLFSSSALYPSYVDKQFISKLLDNTIRVSAEKRAKMLWLIFSLEVWYKKVYKRE